MLYPLPSRVNPSGIEIVSSVVQFASRFMVVPMEVNVQSVTANTPVAKTPNMIVLIAVPVKNFCIFIHFHLLSQKNYIFRSRENIRNKIGVVNGMPQLTYGEDQSPLFVKMLPSGIKYLFNIA